MRTAQFMPRLRTPRLVGSALVASLLSLFLAACSDGALVPSRYTREGAAATDPVPGSTADGEPSGAGGATAPVIAESPESPSPDGGPAAKADAGAGTGTPAANDAFAGAAAYAATAGPSTSKGASVCWAKPGKATPST